ncbi:unnamed protein product [Prorocentrum cordatum]|uniref:alpha-galactosidase n=1 Tax=Prorocentrum cordatum TaxID=2364126 RepID=A0ABN9TL31_9DINO|nr:unnamed protein product [Polarella glacialis]
MARKASFALAFLIVLRRLQPHLRVCLCGCCCVLLKQTGNVNQSNMEAVMDGMVKRNWKVDGVPTSLCELGYCDLGLDDSWQDCSSRRVYSYHDDHGRPLVNLNKFPAMGGMVYRAHRLGLTAGWYANNCICPEGKEATTAVYKRDVEALVAFEFDSLKVDRCGSMQDLNLWVSTLLTTVAWARAGLSRPGCWAHPDVLQVGGKQGPGGPGDPGLSFKEARSHFGAWCIVSSPLILSHDVNNDSVMEEIWPIISNKEAIAVNHAWAGHSGSPFKHSATNITLPGFVDQTDEPIIGDSDAAKRQESPLPSWHFFHKPLGSGRVAVLLMSHTEEEQSLTVSFAEVPGLSCSRCIVRDVWQRRDLGVHIERYAAKGLTGRDSAFLILSPEPRASRQAFAELLRGAGKLRV